MVSALLVTPPDVDAGGVAAEIAGLAPASRLTLPFPSILVASRDDAWVGFKRAHSLAAEWGRHIIDAGEQGHLNADSGIGWWPAGQALLDLLLLAAGGSVGETRTPSAARAILAAVGAGLPSVYR